MASESSAYCVLYYKSNYVTAVLVSRKAWDMPNNPGQQVFPGGGVNDGEDPQRAALRELKEETGVRIDHELTTLTLTRSYRILDLYTYGFGRYSATYVKLSLDDLTSLRWEIGNRLHRRPGELVSVDVVTAVQARATFFVEHRTRKNIGDNTQSTEWFYNIADQRNFD